MNRRMYVLNNMPEHMSIEQAESVAHLIARRMGVSVDDVIVTSGELRTIDIETRTVDFHDHQKGEQ